MDVVQSPSSQPSKNEFIIIGLPAQIKKIPDPSIHLSDNSSSTSFTSDAPVRNVGVTFDPHLSFSNHISNLSRFIHSRIYIAPLQGNYSEVHIRDLRRILPMLDFKTASTIATSIVHSKLDYCNPLFLYPYTPPPLHSKFTCAGRHQS